MLEHARQFLEKVLPAVEPGQFMNIHWSSPGTAGGRFWDGRACANVDEAISTVRWIMGRGDADIYTCMSSQARRETKTSAKGFVYQKALRLAEDAIKLKSLFIDIDVKPDAYPSAGDALRALKKFCDDACLPVPSAVVASGSGGFHAHWTLPEAIPASEWQPLANRLAEAGRQHGLLFDSQCTVDSARILRVPETVNLKGDAPLPVKLVSLGADVPLATLVAALAPYTPTASSLGGLARGQSPFEDGTTARGPLTLAGNDPDSLPGAGDLGANLPTVPALPIRVEDVAKHCGFIARSMGSGGEGVSQPLWFLTATMTSFLEDGREALHAMSSKHASYSPPETDQLFDRVSLQKDQRDFGWPQCAKFSSYGCTECQSCPLLALAQSPLNHVTVAKADTADDSLPEKYFRRPDGIIALRAITDDGVAHLIPVCHYPIITGWLSNNPWTFHFTTVTETGRKAIMEIPTEVIFGKEGFDKFLGAKGFFLTPTQYKSLKEFFVSWLQKLQGMKDSVIAAAPFGWSVVDGKIEGFTYAGRVWMGNDDRPAANPNPVLSYQYTPKGSMAIWSEAARVIYEQGRPALDAILAVGFAGPLVRFTGFPGLILNAYSPESGIGKTTAMKASQAVWGHPVLAMQGLNDTSNSVLGKMGQIRSLPMYWDEIKSEQQVKRFCSIVFDLTGGREKTRMNADATLKMSGTWQTMMVSASNDSLVDGMAREVGSTTAGLHRLFEFVVEKPAQVTRDVGTVQRLVGKLEDNYGHAGLVYAQFLGRNWKRVEQEVADLQDQLYIEASVQQEERMWLATMAVVIKGADYANELGLTTIDVTALRAFLFTVLDKMRGEVHASPSDLNNDMSVSAILAEFLSGTRARNTLITNRIWIAKGRPTAGAIKVLNDPGKLTDIMVQIGRDDGLIRISSVHLSRWMGERGYSRTTFLRRLETEFGLNKVNGKLAGGTDMASAMEHLVELDMNHPKLKPFLE